MKVIICGSRHGLPGTIQEAVDASGFEVTEVVTGEAPGVDNKAAVWGVAKAMKEGVSIGVKGFSADWNAYGKAAGPIRNKRMAEYADACIALPGGSGTRNMVKQAREHGLKVYLHGWSE